MRVRTTLPVVCRHTVSDHSATCSGPRGCSRPLGARLRSPSGQRPHYHRNRRPASRLADRFHTCPPGRSTRYPKGYLRGVGERGNVRRGGSGGVCWGEDGGGVACCRCGWRGGGLGRPRRRRREERREKHHRLFLTRGCGVGFFRGEGNSFLGPSPPESRGGEICPAVPGSSIYTHGSTSARVMMVPAGMGTPVPQKTRDCVSLHNVAPSFRDGFGCLFTLRARHPWWLQARMAL